MSDSFRVKITFGDVTNDDLLVSSLGENRYRLEESPLFTESIFYGDIIEAESSSDGSLTFTQVLERSGMKNYDYVLPRSIFESDEFKKLLERIDETGGHWTQAFGGILLVSLPKESVLDIPWEIENLQN